MLVYKYLNIVECVEIYIKIKNKYLYIFLNEKN